MFGAKAEIALREKGVAFELEMVSFTSDHRYEPKHGQVLRVNPKAQVPVLVDGAVDVFDSTQVFEYLEDTKPEPPLWPADPVGRVRARQLELIADEVLFPPVQRLMGLGRVREKPEWGEARDTIEACYDRLEAALAEGDYLAGSYSYADIAAFMTQFFAARWDVPMSAARPRLTAWRRRMEARPAVAAVWGAMCDFLRSTGLPIPLY
jgi:glutathione S-transferase